ncbi:MAG: bile acid:sodium symporter [Myxococcota bacterium]|nr:bile acid:sodium symporter [Myxococcota bacterium]
MDLAELYPRYEHLLASTQLALAMLGMGAMLTPPDFVRVARAPRALGVGLAVQLVLVPSVAWVVGRTLPVEAGLAAGLVLVAAVPGGTMSNLVTYLARGNIALSISITAVTTVGSLATTPALLRLLVGEHLPAGFDMPVARVAREIAVSLIIPLVVGMMVGTRFPHARDGFSRWAIRGSLFAIGLMVVGAGGSGRLDPRVYGALGLLAVFGVVFAFQLTAWLAARASSLHGNDRIAVVVEATVRNTNLAILVKASAFPAQAGQADPIGDGMLFASLLYGGFAIFAAVPPVLWHRRFGEPWRREDVTG